MLCHPAGVALSDKLREPLWQVEVMLVMLLCVAALYSIQTKLKEQDIGAAKNSLTILALFGCYVTQIHYLCNHHRTDRSLRLMLSHYFIVLSVNLVTIAFKFLENPEADRLFTTGPMIAAFALFFVSVFSNSAYYYDRFAFTKKDVLITAAVLMTGEIIMLIERDSICLLLIGALIAAAGNFAQLLVKYKGKVPMV